MDTLHKVGFTLCNVGAIVCALCSAYFFWFCAYDSFFAAFVTFGVSISFATVAAVINPQEASGSPGKVRVERRLT
jgi:hypothetical protein